MYFAHNAAESAGVDWPVVIGLLAVSAIYTRAVTRLRDRGHIVSGKQIVAFACGIGALVIALLSPVDQIGDEKLLSIHMVQHLIIADLAAPLLLLGVRSPVFLFIWPRPTLVWFMRKQRLRDVLAALTRPQIAVPIWILVLYGWHFTPMFEAALGSYWIHGLQHQSFLIASMLAWWPLLEPHRLRMQGQLWKTGQIVGARMASGFLGMMFVFMKSPLYDWYGTEAQEYGLSPLEDQQIAGALMMMVDIGIAFGGLTFFFWNASRVAGDDPRDQLSTVVETGEFDPVAGPVSPP